jgi:DNA repair exonuclease SbcCD nuclease subunit
LRFLHAGDFHLEQPLYGVAEVPDHLRDLFRDAPYAAAERVFDEALREAVDFVVLSGDLVHVGYAGPRAVEFLIEQFRRLRERDIAVYWASGRVDPPEAWPRSAALPENVHRFGVGKIEEVVHHRHGGPVARLMSAGEDRRGRLPLAELRGEDDLFSIGLAHGQVDEKTLKKQRVDYLALGGKHNRRTAQSAPRMAHWPGTPQGRSPHEAGPHGCTLVEVDREGRVRARLLPVDVARWSNPRLEIGEETTREQLEALLREQLQTQTTAAGERDLLLQWTVVGAGPLGNQLRRGALAEELLARLQTEHGFGPPAAWSFSLQAGTPAELPEAWHREDTILGDFLRLVEQYLENPDLELDLEPYHSERHLAGSLGDAARLDDDQRERVLREAAHLGGELLSGGENG